MLKPLQDIWPFRRLVKFVSISLVTRVSMLLFILECFVFMLYSEARQNIEKDTEPLTLPLLADASLPLHSLLLQLHGTVLTFINMSDSTLAPVCTEQGV